MMIVVGQRIQGGNVLGPVQKPDYDAVVAENWKLVVFGRLKYSDIFGKVHHTDFSFVYNRKQWADGTLGFVIDPNGYSDAD